MDTEKISLEEENKLLKHKLEIAQKWMQSQVSGSQNSIKNKANFKDDIEEKIYDFFSPESLSNFPSNGIENIVSAETLFHHLEQGEEFDGISILISYGKILDQMIELYITKGFRKYIIKNKLSPKYINDPLEKSLRLIVEKKHIFSLGRLYQSLDIISKGNHSHPYLVEFSNYIKSREFLGALLLKSGFLLQLESLIHSHAMTDKRHSGTLSRSDTISAREAIIGDFTDTNCLLYILSSSQNVSG